MMFFESPYDPIFTRGDSVALAVQAGKIHFKTSDYSKELEDLVAAMLNVDPDFRLNIASVMEKVEILMNQNNDKL